MKKIALLILSLSLISISPAFAQIDDIGVWGGISVNKLFTRKIEASLTQQIRLNHDATTIDVALTDLGIDYSITKAFRISGHYRFINSNQENYYSKRHRFYIDLSYRYKIDFITLSIRERIQQQFNNYYSSETGKIPIWTLRSKLTAKFDIDKEYTPYISGEVYYLLDNPENDDPAITRFRYEIGFSYDFNRVHSLNPFILFQHATSPVTDELVYGLMYSVSF